MPASPTQTGRITVVELKGLNEREIDANSDLGYFDFLRGCVPINKNTLTRCNGSTLLLNFGEPVLSIHQTNDSRGNIIVQTLSSVRIVSTNELFGTAINPTNLVPVASTEEESMSQAIIVHQLAAGTNGGTYTTLNVWQQAPLSAILSQLNPDGTTAAFVTSLTANQFTLATGIYRIRGYSVMSNVTGATKMAARLFNVTASTPAWSGLANEDSPSVLSGGASYNEQLPIAGTLNLVAPTTFEVQGLQSRVQTNTGFGIFASAAGFGSAKELYRFLEILKTA